MKTQCLRGLAGMIGVSIATALGACTGELVTSAGGEESSESGSDDSDGDDPGAEPGVSTTGQDGTTGAPPPPAQCGDGVLEGTEACDGTDFGGDSCEAMGAFGQLRCKDDCTLDICGCTWDEPVPECDPPSCGDGRINGRDEVCDGEDFGGGEGWRPQCSDILGEGYDGEVGCTSNCFVETSGCGLCGDGIVERGEDCDGPPVDADGDPRTCEDALGVGGAALAQCTDGCAWDEGACVEPCGNGALDPGEECDGPLDSTCADLGFPAGTITCSPQCVIEDLCTTCGDGVIDPGESCDGEAIPTCGDEGFVGGESSCSADCQLDVSNCGTCGDGFVNALEQCEVGDGSVCACTESCTYSADCVALVISEILYAPLASPNDKEGQWIEIHNPTDAPLDLQGCIIDGDGQAETFEIDAPAPIDAGGYATIGFGSVEELGFEPTFLRPLGVTLWNGGDTVSIVCAGVEIDAVTYDDAAPWPDPPAGISIALGELDPLANDDGATWCASSFEYGIGQRGTPGAPNDCP